MPTKCNQGQPEAQGEEMKMGRFFVPKEWLKQDIGLVQQIMCRCVPVGCAYKPYNGSYEYTAISDEFDDVPDQLSMPDYRIVTANGEFVRFENSDTARKAEGEK